MRKSLAWKVLPVVVLLGVLLLLSNGAPVGEEKSYVGDVEIDQQDDSGAVTSIYLADTDEGDLLVAKSGPWDDLVKAAGETVEAWGTLSETDNEDFDYVITITRFEVIEDDADDPNDSH